MEEAKPWALELVALPRGLNVAVRMVHITLHKTRAQATSLPRKLVRTQFETKGSHSSNKSIWSMASTITMISICSTQRGWKVI